MGAVIRKGHDRYIPRESEGIGVLPVGRGLRCRRELREGTALIRRPLRGFPI
jgi:hypothetical protein